MLHYIITIIIIVVNSIVRYPTEKGKHTVLYKTTNIHINLNNIYTYIYKHNIPCTSHTHQHTHTNTWEHRERNATGTREGGEGGQERKKTEFEISCSSTV